MLRKNVAGQFIHFAGIVASTGAALTGATFSYRRCIDGTFAAGGGTITEDTGTGFYKVALAQADTNGNDIGFFFTASTAVPVCINVITTACDPTSTAFGLSLAKTTNITGFNDIAATSIVSSGAITTSGGAVSTVTTVTNQLTAAAIATGVWTDTTASDFTTALSIGKSVMNGVSLGTGLTVNSLTNAPTAGDFTATMKTSIGTAVAASAVASVTAGVTVTTNNDKTGYALTSAYDFAKGTVAMTESYAANTIAPTPVQAMFAIHQALMDFNVTGTTITTYKLDHITAAFLNTIDSATTPTQSLRT